jgi:cation-transporting P-type ATPase C
MEFTSLSVIMGLSLIKSKILKLAVGQTLFSPLGIAVSFFALPLVYRGLKDFKNQKKPTLDSFLAAGIGAALVGGEALTALEILWVHSGSELLSSYVAERSRNEVRKILDVTSSTAFVVRDGKEIEVHISEVQCGETVICHHGEKVAVDGPVIKGEAVLNEASINGNSELIHKKENDEVFAGTYVQDGTIWVTAQKVGDETYLSRILSMVENSMEHKAPIELKADRLANNLVRIGLLATAATFLVTGSFYRAFSVLLIMACPCATTLSASSSVSAALSNAAAKGILIKGGRYLEEAGKQKSFCFDKTGTLTTEHPVITDIIPLEGFSEEDLIKSASIAELHSRHPVASSIRELAESWGFSHSYHTICESVLGMGVRSESDNSVYLVGNRKLMDKYGINLDSYEELKQEFRGEGKTVIFIAANEQLQGVFLVENRIKEGALEIIEALREDGVKELIMITGDEESSAKALAEKLHFDSCHPSVLPDQKAEIIQELQKKHKVAMVGDGINDVLALANADIGIAMGIMGTDVAIETADIALADDDLTKIVYLRKLSAKTDQIINQNFTLATVTNMGGALLGAAGLLSPVMAGLIHIAHTLGIMANSGRLLTYSDNTIKIETDND